MARAVVVVVAVVVAVLVARAVVRVVTGEEVSISLGYALWTKDRQTPPMLAPSKRNQKKN